MRNRQRVGPEDQRGSSGRIEQCLLVGLERGNHGDPVRIGGERCEGRSERGRELLARARRAAVRVDQRSEDGGELREHQDVAVGDLLGDITRDVLDHLRDVVVGEVLPGPAGHAVVEPLQHLLSGAVCGDELLGLRGEDLAPDGGAGRLRGPYGERAPGGVLPGPGVPELHRELVVALGYQEVPQHGVRHRRNLLHRHVHPEIVGCGTGAVPVSWRYLGGGTLTRRPGASSWPTGPCMTFSNWSRRCVTEMPSQYRPP